MKTSLPNARSLTLGVVLACIALVGIGLWVIAANRENDLQSVATPSYLKRADDGLESTTVSLDAAEGRGQENRRLANSLHSSSPEYGVFERSIEERLTIAGVIWNQEKDEPVELADVRVLCEEFVNGALTKKEVAVRSDEAGQFCLNEVPQRVRQLTVSCEGYAKRLLLSDVLHLPITMKVSKGEREIDLGKIWLSTGVSILGRVDAVDGSGIDEAPIFLAKGRDPIWSGSAELLARTNARGEFQSLRRIEETKHTLFCLDGDTGLAWREIEPIKGLESLEVLLAMNSAGEVRVLVEDETGGPVSNIRVWADPRFLPLGFPSRARRTLWQIKDSELMSVFSAVTSDGVATFLKLPLDDTDRGNYSFVVHHDGVTYWTDNVTVGLRAADCTIELRKSSFRIHGRVTTKDGGQISNANLSLLGSGVEVHSWVDGTYELNLNDWDNDHVLVRVSAECFGDGIVKQMLSNKSIQLDFQLEESAPITGVVESIDGLPIVGVKLHLQNSGMTYDEISNESGEFSFESTSPGDWSLSTWGDGLGEWDHSKAYSVMGGEFVRLTLNSALRGDAVAEIAITDLSLGTPLMASGVMVWPFDNPPGVSRDVAKQASIEFGKIVVRDLAEGNWRIWAGVPNRPAAFVEIEIQPGDSLIRSQIEVGDYATIDGFVDLSGIKDPDWAYVWGIPPHDDPIPSGANWIESHSSSFSKVQIDGSFTMKNCRPGNTRLVLVGRCTPGVPFGSQIPDGVSFDYLGDFNAELYLEVPSGGAEWVEFSNVKLVD